MNLAGNKILLKNGPSFIYIDRAFSADTVEKLGNLAGVMNRDDFSFSDYLYLPKIADKYWLIG